MAELRFGTCSWKYPSWHGLVYSQPKGINYLQEYAKKYNSVEIDQWFWSLFKKGSVTLPDPEVVKSYVDAVGEDFQFSIKVPNSITLTHFYRSAGYGDLEPNPDFLSPDLFAQFIETVTPMVPFVSSLMFQFEYLNKRKMVSQEAFLQQIDTFLTRIPRNIPLSLEPRNPHWLNRRYFAFLKSRHLAHVFLQGYYMQDIREVYTKNRDLITESAIIRLHGNDREGIEERTGKKYHRIVDDREVEMRGIARMVNDLLERGVKVLINVNNHFEGSAPLTISRFRSYL